MGRIVAMALGTVAAAFVLFNFILPMVTVLFKVALVIGVIALVVFIAVRVISGSPSR
ncbi:hypothetical protein [Nonomuraea typhae]|uniref:hypothetical protein n=1 Tax=Nonomuraea typhae TaxID=2603600 RepID=UPI0012F8B6E5|nr:hypothetical protein [Nonomuraea typhae]